METERTFTEQVSVYNLASHRNIMEFLNKDQVHQVERKKNTNLL